MNFAFLFMILVAKTSALGTLAPCKKRADAVSSGVLNSFASLRWRTI